MTVTQKALTNFSSLTLIEKYEFYHTFTRAGFRDAMRTGRLSDGSELKAIGRGRFQDALGVTRTPHGPFWPTDYGPLEPAPPHARRDAAGPEPLTAGPEPLTAGPEPLTAGEPGLSGTEHGA